MFFILCETILFMKVYCYSEIFLTAMLLFTFNPVFQKKSVFYALSRSSLLEVFCKKSVFKKFAKFTKKHLCQSLFLIKLQPQACNFIKKETLAQVFSCGFCEISKITFSYRTPLQLLLVISTVKVRC